MRASIFASFASVRRSPTLANVWRDFRLKAGRELLKAIGRAALLGAITYFLGRQVGLTVAIAVVLAVVLALASLFGMLILAVPALERQLAQASTTIAELNQMIGAQRAIGAWVMNCEASLSDQGNPAPTTERARQELSSLEANVINSLNAVPFYPASHVEQVRAIAHDPDQPDATVRLERLLAHLRKQLVAGAYLHA